MATSTPPSSVETRTQAIGAALLAASAAYRPVVAERIEDWLLTRAVADDRFRTRLLRYMDVLASLDHDRGGGEAKRLAQEYFGDDFPGLPRALRWLLRIGRDEHLPAPLVGETARRAAEVFARRFITPPGDDTIERTLRELREAGRHPSFDLLGEAVLSEHEAEAYVAGYLRLIAQLSRLPGADEVTAGEVARLQVSLKLSSLTAHFSPVDPEGTVRRVRPALEAICEAAERAGVALTVDMEQYAYRDLTWDLFRRAFARGERFGAWPGAGIVVQAYLRDAHLHAEEVASFARARGTPFQVRLVKGAYWDYETIVAREGKWPSPVFARKGDTDRQFERVLPVLVRAHPHVRLAVGSHNARTHAVARAEAEAAGLPPGALEHQTLFRTAQGMSDALSRMGWVARDYVPVGELLPGMAYLVRRVLENSSQAGFLLQSRRGVPAEELLRAPPPGDPEPPEPARDPGRFQRAPAAPWFDAGHRAAFDRALAETRARWGERLALRVAGEPVEAAEAVGVFSPSAPSGPPVGVAELAGLEATERAIAATRAGAGPWAALPVEERAGVLRRAAARLWERRHEFAAWVVHEGGRDRVAAYAEVEEAVDLLEYYTLQAEALFARHGAVIAPRGVVAVIPPWNFSLSIPCGMTAAALVCGNAAILKPAEQTPLIAQRLVALLHEAGVPAGALVGLPGRGEVVGAALAEHAGVAMVAFTGSRAVGTLLHETVARVAPAAGGLKALVAEMGGKNPVIVFADADLDEAVAAILASAFGHANQRCSAASRVLVERPVFARLRERLVEAARSLHVGPGDDPATQVNPVIDRDARARLLGAAADARAECEVLLDRFEAPHGAAPAGAETLALGPLIVALEPDVAPRSRTANEELFGPILLLVPFDDEAEAYALANGTAYGLTAGIFSRSPRTVERALEAVETGNLYVNRAITGARVGVEPFGGMWLSGTGPKAGGPDYLWAFVRRTDVPTGDEAGASGEPAGGGPVTETAPARPTLPEELAARWEAPFARRVEAVEGAAALLGARGERGAEPLFSVAQAARRELGRPRPSEPVAGQRSELRAGPPRGLGLVHAAGADAAWWLAAALVAGNGCAVVASPGLAPVVAALHEAGVPAQALAEGGGSPAALPALAASPRVAFVATDAAGALVRATHAALGPTAEGQRWLKALLSPLDGPQPREPGFVRRFAWTRAVAVRTLRHGAELALEVDGGR